MEYAKQCMNMCVVNTRYSADPDDIGAQIDLIGLPWLMIGEDPSSAPNGGYLRTGCGPAPVTERDQTLDPA